MIDLHIHSTVSDGTDTPEEVLEKVKASGIRLFALTDHDAVKGSFLLGRRLGNLPPSMPILLSGVEFSCKDEKGKYHILGYGFDPEAASVSELVETGHRFRMNKTQRRLEELKSQFGIDFSEEDKKRLLALDNPGKPHLGNLMARYGFARTKDEAIRAYINRVHVASEYLRPEAAIEGILQGGGVPVLAHPLFGSGSELIRGAEMEQRLLRLMDYGLQGMEAFYSGFSPEERQEVLDLADQYDLYVTAGSDYHGTNKKVRLGDTGLGDIGFADTRLSCTGLGEVGQVERGEWEYPRGLLRFLERVQVREKLLGSESG